MADQTYSDDNTGGFTTDDDGTWATSGGDTTGDYDNWDWRKIMAAICGGSAFSDNSHNNDRAAEYSDPQTLQQAADSFWYAEQVLKEAAQWLTSAIDTVTGENGAWKGAAAQALNQALTTVAKQTQQMADTLSGGVTGDYDVPQQLANNAMHLKKARDKVVDIDHWYARQAMLMDATSGMDDNLVRVNNKPELVKMMSDDMRQVLVTLAKHYELNVDSVSQPDSPNNPNNNPYGSSNGNGSYGNGYGSYGNGNGSYGNGNGSYGNGNGSYGNGNGSYGNGYGSYGNGNGSYGNGYGSYGNGYGSYGNGYGSYGNGNGSYGNGYGSYGNGSYGNGNGSYGNGYGSYGNGSYGNGNGNGSPYGYNTQYQSQSPYYYNYNARNSAQEPNETPESWAPKEGTPVQPVDYGIPVRDEAIPDDAPVPDAPTYPVLPTEKTKVETPLLPFETQREGVVSDEV